MRRPPTPTPFPYTTLFRSSAIESAWPRTIAASRPLSLRGGSGNRALPAASPGRSAADPTSSPGGFAFLGRQPPPPLLHRRLDAIDCRPELEVVDGPELSDH